MADQLATQRKREDRSAGKRLSEPRHTLTDQRNTYEDGRASTAAWKTIDFFSWIGVLLESTCENVGLLFDAYIMPDGIDESEVSQEDFAIGEFDDWRALSRFILTRRFPADPADCLAPSVVVADAALTPVPQSALSQSVRRAQTNQIRVVACC